MIRDLFGRAPKRPATAPTPTVVALSCPRCGSPWATTTNSNHDGSPAVVVWACPRCGSGWRITGTAAHTSSEPVEIRSGDGTTAVAAPAYAVGDEGWMGYAACRGHSPAMFFPQPGLVGTQDRLGVLRAQGVCSHCSVREACLDYAVRHEIGDGVWGGLDEPGRRNVIALRRRRTRRAIWKPNS